MKPSAVVNIPQLSVLRLRGRPCQNSVRLPHKTLRPRHRLQIRQRRRERNCAFGAHDVDAGGVGRFGVGADLLRRSLKQFEVADAAHERKPIAGQAADVLRRARLRVPMKAVKTCLSDHADAVARVATDVKNQGAGNRFRQLCMDDPQSGVATGRQEIAGEEAS